MKMHLRAALVCRIEALHFALVLILAGALGQLQFPSLVWAQRKKAELRAEQVPASQAAPPKIRFHTVKSDPNNSLKLYSATAEGLQVSENGGLSWQPLAVGGRHEEVFAFSVHPLNPDSLFVGRRDGLWKSQDGGRSWSALPYPVSVPLSIAIARTQPDTLYLATARQGVHKSTDGGYQWAEINKGLPEARAGGRPEEIHTLVVDPFNANLVYAALSRHGIYRTVDGGGSWHEFNRGLPFPIARPIHPPRFAYDPEDLRRLYLTFNQPIHSHLIRTRLYLLSDTGEWLPVEAELPSNFAVLGLVIDGARRIIQLWGAEVVWELPLPAK